MIWEESSLLLLLWKNWPLCTRLCKNPSCGITMGSQQNRTLWTLAIAPSPASGQDITVRETGPYMRIEAELTLLFIDDSDLMETPVKLLKDGTEWALVASPNKPPMTT